MRKNIMGGPKGTCKMLFKGIKDIIVILDKEGRIIDINSAVKKLTGFSPKEIKGHHFKELKFVNPESKGRIARYFKKRLKGLKTLPYYEIEGVAKNGRRIIAEVSATPFLRKGKIIGSLAIIRDVAKHKRVEEEIKNYQRRTESLINSSSDLIFLKDKNFRYLIANKAHEKLFNIKVEDIIGKTDFDFMPKEAAEGCRKSDAEALKSGFISREEWVGGKCFHAIKQKVVGAKGKIIGITAVIRDITERKQIEERLKKSKEFAESLIASTKDGFSILDSRGVHININEALCKMTGFSREELIGVGPPHPYWPPEEYENIQKAFKKTLRGEFKDFELIFMRKNGERFPVIVSPSWLRKEKGEVISYFATVKDITERKRIDRAKTEFVSLASHQLRTPLTNINWYSEMLLLGKAGELSNQQIKYLKEIYTANQQLIKLVNLLLNVSRIELGTLGIKPEPIDIIEIANIVLKELLPQIKNKKLKVEKNYSKKLPIINADPNIVHIVFENLLSNAVKYTPKRGRVKLLIKKQKSDVLIRVSDTGYGIPKDQQSRIFTKFFRADNIVEKEPNGTGLGLYIAKSVLEQSGGKIWFESEENKGTTFYVAIPIEEMKKKKGTKKLSI